MAKIESIGFGGRTVFKASGPFAFKVFVKMLFSPFSLPFRDLLRSAWKNYFKTQYVNAPEVDVTTALDRRIPFVESAVRNYLSFVPLSLGVISFLHAEFGRDACREIRDTLTKGEDLYAHAGGVYRSIQSTFRREGNGWLGVKILRFIDKSKNCYPSLHTQIVGEVYLLLRKSVGNYASHPDRYAQLEKQIFDQSVRILEACCITKQHSVQDIAAGFAALSYKDPEFTEDMARDFMHHIFRSERYGLGEQLVLEIRAATERIYSSLVWELRAKDDYSLVFVSRLRAMGEAG